jgi:exopolyphosphatase/guanosine-5'-triphosphate,3'-diphosphate pyrophosphatase
VIAATIDIGTNTALLLVGRVSGTGEIETLVYEQRIPRLGEGVDAGRVLTPGAIARVTAVLEEYRTIIGRYSPDAVVVAATSAVRDARNRDEFRRHVKERTGFDLEILPGHEEALLTFSGALSGITDLHRATVVDIGGGSTEITVGTRSSIADPISLDIGSVRLTERFFGNDPPTAAELLAAESFVRQELRRRTPETAGTTLVAVAGTATALAILDQRLEEFDRKAVTNYRLSEQKVAAIFARLSELPSASIRKLSKVLIGREDVITAGALILRELMRHLKFGELVVSERGIRYGLVLREWERMKGQPFG